MSQIWGYSHPFFLIIIPKIQNLRIYKTKKKGKKKTISTTGPDNPLVRFRLILPTVRFRLVLPLKSKLASSLSPGIAVNDDIDFDSRTNCRRSDFDERIIFRVSFFFGIDILLQFLTRTATIY